MKMEVGQSEFTIAVHFTYLSAMNCGRWRRGAMASSYSLQGSPLGIWSGICRKFRTLTTF
jgi:hypothetical protein